MSTINTTDNKGKSVQIPEHEFQKAIIGYLRETSPNRVKIIAEMQNTNGISRPVPVVILMLAKNPAEVMSYTDVIPLESEPESDQQ